MTSAFLSDFDLPPGRYVLLTKEVFERMRAELIANPDIFRSIGSFQTWNLDVDDPAQDEQP